jgi:hypothetical protein
MGKILDQKTVPWVDAFVKFVYALMPLARPVGSFILTWKGIDMASTSADGIDVVEGGLMAAFPTWMGAREVDKGRKAKVAEKQVVVRAAKRDDLTYLDEGDWW